MRGPTECLMEEDFPLPSSVPASVYSDSLGHTCFLIVLLK